MLSMFDLFCCGTFGIMNFAGISHQDQVDTSTISPFVQVCLQVCYLIFVLLYAEKLPCDLADFSYN